MMCFELITTTTSTTSIRARQMEFIVFRVCEPAIACSTEETLLDPWKLNPIAVCQNMVFLALGNRILVRRLDSVGRMLPESAATSFCLQVSSKINQIRCGRLESLDVLLVAGDDATVSLFQCDAIAEAPILISNVRDGCEDNSTWSIVSSALCTKFLLPSSQPQLFYSDASIPLAQSASQSASCIRQPCLIAAGSNSHRVSVWKVDPSTLDTLSSRHVSDHTSHQPTSDVLKRAVIQFELDESKLDLVGPKHNVPAVDINRDQTLLAAASIDKSVSLFDPNDGTLLVRREIGSSWGWAVRFLPKQFASPASPAILQNDTLNSIFGDEASEHASESEESNESDFIEEEYELYSEMSDELPPLDSEDEISVESGDFQTPPSQSMSETSQQDHPTESTRLVEVRQNETESPHEIELPNETESPDETESPNSIERLIQARSSSDVLLYCSQTTLYLFDIVQKDICLASACTEECQHEMRCELKLLQRIPRVANITLTRHVFLDRLNLLEIIPEFSLVLVASGASDQILFLALLQSEGGYRLQLHPSWTAFPPEKRGLPIKGFAVTPIVNEADSDMRLVRYRLYVTYIDGFITAAELTQCAQGMLSCIAARVAM